jgi:hypothetical protein
VGPCGCIGEQYDASRPPVPVRHMPPRHRPCSHRRDPRRLRCGSNRPQARFALPFSSTAQAAEAFLAIGFVISVRRPLARLKLPIRRSWKGRTGVDKPQCSRNRAVRFESLRSARSSVF